VKEYGVLLYSSAMEFTATEEVRLDGFIAKHDEGLSRTKIQDAIKEGLVSVNGKIVMKPAYKLSPDDVVVFDEESFNKPPEDAVEIDPIDMKFEILYEDDAVIVINKPAGISVHPGHSMDKSEKTILNGVRFLFEERKIPFSPDSVLAHRLDKPTTGCLCVVKNYNSHAALQKQFQDRTIKKSYLAIVAGIPDHKTAIIDAPIGRSLTDRTKMAVVKTSTSRDAKTTYTVVDNTHDTSLLRCDLHTGRTHQIRVHLTSVDHPILGDIAYASVRSDELTEQLKVQNLCLHAENLTFVSPVDNIEHSVEAPLPPAMLDTLSKAELSLTPDQD